MVYGSRSITTRMIPHSSCIFQSFNDQVLTLYYMMCFMVFRYLYCAMHLPSSSPLSIVQSLSSLRFSDLYIQSCHAKQRRSRCPSNPSDPTANSLLSNHYSYSIPTSRSSCSRPSSHSPHHSHTSICPRLPFPPVRAHPCSYHSGICTRAPSHRPAQRLGQQ